MLYHALQLVGEVLLLELDLGHHALEDLLAISLALFLQFHIPLIAAAEKSAVGLLSFLAHLVLGLLAALLEGEDALAFELRDGSVVEVVESLAGEDELAAEAADQTNAGVVQQVNRDDGLQLADEGHNIFLIVDLVGFQIEMGELGEPLQLFAVRDVRDQVMGEIERHEFIAVFEALHARDPVVREIQNGQVVEVQQALHALNLVLMEVQAPHFRHVVEARDLLDAIRLKPDCFALRICVQVLDFLETYDDVRNARLCGCQNFLDYTYLYSGGRACYCTSA